MHRNAKKLKKKKEICLMQLYNLKHSTHNKNYKMILAIGCVDMCLN